MYYTFSYFVCKKNETVITLNPNAADLWATPPPRADLKKKKMGGRGAELRIRKKNKSRYWEISQDLGNVSVRFGTFLTILGIFALKPPGSGV